MYDSAKSTPGRDDQPRSKPLDARLARCLIGPLQGARLTPNHLTLFRVALGLAGCAMIATGVFAFVNLGAFLFVLSNFVDHTDGELARLTGQYSAFGHWLDLAGDFVIHVLLFAALGYGLSAGDDFTLTVLGVFVGVVVATIFILHAIMESRLGKDGARLPALGWFEAEDVMYLFPLVTLFSCGGVFLWTAAIGAPLFAAGLLWQVFIRQSAPSRA